MQKPKFPQNKWKVATVILSVVLLTVSLFAAVSAQGGATYPLLHVDQLPSTASYIINTDGAGNYWAVNGSTGAIEWSSTNPDSVFSNIIATHMNGTLLVKDGTYTFNGQLDLSNTNIRLVGEGKSTTLYFPNGNGIYISDSDSTYKHEISYLTLQGLSQNGTGLNMTRVTGMGSYNLKIIYFNIGLQINAGSLMNTFYGFESQWNNDGVYIYKQPGASVFGDHNGFAGGRIGSNNHYGVRIAGEITSTQFSKVEIENNIWAEVSLETIDVDGTGYMPTLNVFDGCYFEAENATESFVQFNTNATRPPRGNIFINNKFGLHVSTTLVIDGNLNDFQNNAVASLSSKTLAITISGSDVVFKNNFRQSTSATVTVTVSGSRTQIESNEFYVTQQIGAFTNKTDGDFIAYGTALAAAATAISLNINNATTTAIVQNAYSGNATGFFLMLKDSSGNPVSGQSGSYISILQP